MPALIAWPHPHYFDSSAVATGLRALLTEGDTNLVRLPRSPRVAALVRELESFEHRITESGTYTGEARTGAHDDLVVALGLAVLLDPSAMPMIFTGPSPYI